jgi:hypothetical protein
VAFQAVDATLQYALAGNNKTVISTSDSAPTYSFGSNAPNSEVVIGWNQPSGSPPTPSVTIKVMLTTTCDPGDIVSLAASNYHCSAGVSIESGSPAYPNPADKSKMVATFDFDPTTIGKVNTITMDPPIHTTTTGAGGSGTITCNGPPGTPGALANAGGIKFTICIPNVALSPGQTPPNKPNPFNLGLGYLFYVQLTVIGLDDLNQVELTQNVNNSSDWTNIDGTDSPPTGTWSNTNGFVPDDGWAWAVPTNDVNNIDIQEYVTYLGPSPTGPSAWYSTVINGETWHYQEVGWTQNGFQDLLRRNTGKVQLCEFDWGYKWNNQNAVWQNPPPVGSTLPARPDSIKSAILKKLGPGKFTVTAGAAPVP